MDGSGEGQVRVKSPKYSELDIALVDVNMYVILKLCFANRKYFIEYDIQIYIILT